MAARRIPGLSALLKRDPRTGLRPGKTPAHAPTIRFSQNAIFVRGPSAGAVSENGQPRCLSASLKAQSRSNGEQSDNAVTPAAHAFASSSRAATELRNRVNLNISSTRNKSDERFVPRSGDAPVAVRSQTATGTSPLHEIFGLTRMAVPVRPAVGWGLL
jgi:hypothetical protein